MATITELEQTVPRTFSFLKYVLALFGYIMWIFSKPLEIFRDFFNTNQVYKSDNEDVNDKSGELTLARRNRNWIDNRRHDNGWRHNVKTTSHWRMTCVEDVLKLLGQRLKQVYTGLDESPESPSSTTFSHVIIANLFQSPNRTSYEPDPDYESIMSKLTWLQDNGEFDEFDKYSSSLLGDHRNESPDITAAVLIEQSRCMLYRNRLAQAKFLARRSLELATSTACPAMYIARACLVLSACYRAKGKLGKAKIFLDKAWQNLVITKCYEDWARYYDAYGSYLNGISDTVTQPGEKILDDAKECFFKQLEAAESCGSRKMRQKQQFYALLKMARTLLDANTMFGQQREVPDADVTRAGEYLDKIEAEVWEDVSRGAHMQFLLIRVKQYYRQRRFDEAVTLLTEGIGLASVDGYEHLPLTALMIDGLKTLKSKAALQKTESCKEQLNDTFDSSSDDRNNLESFNSSSDSVQIYDSEFNDSC